MHVLAVSSHSSTPPPLLTLASLLTGTLGWADDVDLGIEVEMDSSTPTVLAPLELSVSESAMVEVPEGGGWTPAQPGVEWW